MDLSGSGPKRLAWHDSKMPLAKQGTQLCSLKSLDRRATLLLLPSQQAQTSTTSVAAPPWGRVGRTLWALSEQVPVAEMELEGGLCSPVAGILLPDQPFSGVRTVACRSKPSHRVPRGRAVQASGTREVRAT